MQRTTWRRLLPALLCVVLLASACGSDEPTESGESDGAEAGTEANDGAAVDEEAAASGEATSGPLAPPDIWQIVSPAPPTELPSIEAEASAIAQIEAMFTDVGTFVASDPRSPDNGLLDLIERRGARQAPDLVLAVFASITANGADTYGIIEAHASAGLDAGFDPDSAPYFEVRLEAAQLIRGVNLEAHGLMVRARDLPLSARSCLASAIVDDLKSCDDSAEGQTLVDDYLALQDIEFPDELDDFDDQLGREADLCSLWGNVDASSLELVDVFISGSLLDSRFLGRSECRSSADVERYPEFAMSAAPLAPVYAAVVTAGSAAEYDEDVYHSDDYLVSLLVQRSSTADIVAAALPAAGAWQSQNEPNARYALLSINYLGQLETWFQRVMLDNDIDNADDWYVALDELVPCGRLFSPDGLPSECSDADRAFNDALLVVEITDYRAAAPVDIIDWEDVGSDLGVCSEWLSALQTAAATDQERIDFQMSQLGLEDIFGVDDCETGLDSGDSATD